MNPFTVRWTKAALDQLAEIWLAHSDREAVSRASHFIEQQLASNASNAGAELHEGLRVIKVAPLRAIYLVEERTVEIARVTLI